MEIPDDFNTYCTTVVIRHFANAPKPDGTTATNREHLRVKSAAIMEIRQHINKLSLDHDAAYAYERYAEDKAQRALFDLFIVPIKKNRRYKGMQGY